MALKQNREYFWSNKFVDPKRKSRFTVEFSGEFDRLSQGKYPWMIKSVSRPKFSADYDSDEYRNQFTNAIGPVVPKAWSWKEITVKFVNPYSFTFASEVKQDLDDILTRFTSAKNNPGSYVVKGMAAVVREESTIVAEDPDAGDPLSESMLGRVIKIYDLSMAYEPQEAEDSLLKGIPNVDRVIQQSSHYNLTPLEVKLGEMYPNGYWTLIGPWITSIDFGDHDYASDDLLEISLTFRFKRATYTSLFHEKLISKDPDKAPIIAEEATRLATAINDARRKGIIDLKKEQQSLDVLGNNLDEQLLKRFQPSSYADKGLESQRMAEIKKAKDYIDSSLKLNGALQEFSSAAVEQGSGFNGRYADALSGLSESTSNLSQAYNSSLTIGENAANYTSGNDTYKPPKAEVKPKAKPKSSTPKTAPSDTATPATPVRPVERKTPTTPVATPRANQGDCRLTSAQEALVNLGQAIRSDFCP